MKGLLGISSIHVPLQAIDATMDFLRHRGTMGLEAFSLWAGRADGNVFSVLANIIPAQEGHTSEEGICVSVGPEELHRLNVWLYENKMTLIAQIHSHPTEAYHSETDDEYPIATTVGCISIVIPNFARQSFSVGRCAIYRLNEFKEWAYLDTPEVLKLIHVID
jgi:hypothetical protein